MDASRTKLVVLFSIFIVSGLCKSDDKPTSARINGQALLEMGVIYRKPLLRLIGKSLMDIECRQHGGCAPWSEWSECEPHVGQYGMRNRSRLCGGGGNMECPPASREQYTDTENVVCQKFCPSDYEMMKGFCLKYYNTTKKAKADAETNCKNDKAHLLNINSQQKWTAYASLMDKYKSANEYIYINGQRKNPNSPWEFTYESFISGYTNWGSGDPDNGNADLCLLAYNGGNSGVYDNPCTASRYYVCEIIPSFI